MLTLRIFLITLDIVAITVVLLWNRKMLWRGTSAPDTHSSEIQFVSCLDVSNTIEEQVLSMMYRSESGNWCCSVCGKEFKIKNDMKRHVESLHITNHPGYVCNYCGDTVKSKNALRLHISSKHPYQWNEIYQNEMIFFIILFRGLWQDWGIHFIHDVSVRDQELDLLRVWQRIQTKDRYHETCWG